MPERDSTDQAFMAQAIELARRAWGKTQPNPMVGALIVEDGKVVASGFHPRPGQLHAERLALKKLGRPPAEGATMYVTLEPCSSFGRTPPCCGFIISSGIRRVVIGATDPNPLHDGRAVDLLVDAGIEVQSGVLAEDCEDLNLLFNHQISTREPLFAAKVATTIDGYIATRTGDSKWITGELARQDVMRWRTYFPAIAVGAGTVRKDNPHLTRRLHGRAEDAPLRFVFDASLSTVEGDYHLYTDAFASQTVVVTLESASDSQLACLERRGLRAWRLPKGPHGISLSAFRQRCQEEAIQGVYFEGGSSLLSSLLRERVLDYLFAYRAPKFLGDASALPFVRGEATELMANSFELARVRHDRFGDDELMRGFVQYPAEV